ncbi:MAG: ferritin-like domain-containing protein [Actinomycetota bacterium]|nr:ferritin-like domain-containing protein [Actinomycetota bacterium]
MSKETVNDMDVPSDDVGSNEMESLSTTAFSRRRFLVGSGVVAGLAVATAACGSDEEPSGGGQTSTTQGGQQGASGDAAVASLAAGLEVLAVGTYKAALDAATAGKLGAVPPAGAEFVKTAMAQHQQHLDAWNKVLQSAGQPQVTQPNAKLKPTVDAELTKAKTFADAAKLALTLEETAAATYLSAIPQLEDKAAVKQAASIQAVDAKHAAILHFVLGEYPVPDTFAKDEKAVKA